MANYEKDCCPECNGSGEGPHESIVCRECGSEGEVWVKIENEEQQEEL